AAVVGGLLAPISEDHVNVVNVDIIAQRRGLQITEKRGPSHELYANLVKVRIGSKAGGAEIAGTLAHDGPHIVSIDGFWVDVPPSEGYLLLVENKDRPGMVGAVGTLMGEYRVNISFMNVGRHEKRGTALMVLALDETLAAGEDVEPDYRCVVAPLGPSRPALLRRAGRTSGKRGDLAFKLAGTQAGPYRTFSTRGFRGRRGGSSRRGRTRTWSRPSPRQGR